MKALSDDFHKVPFHFWKSCILLAPFRLATCKLHPSKQHSLIIKPMLRQFVINLTMFHRQCDFVGLSCALGSFRFGDK